MARRPVLWRRCWGSAGKTEDLSGSHSYRSIKERQSFLAVPRRRTCVASTGVVVIAPSSDTSTQYYSSASTWKDLGPASQTVRGGHAIRAECVDDVGLHVYVASMAGGTPVIPFLDCQVAQVVQRKLI